MQVAVLSFPGSDGLVRLTPMLDYLWAKFPQASREDFLHEVENALQKLRRLGDLYLERQDNTERRPMTIDEWQSFALLNFVKWDSERQRWEPKAVEDVLVQLSQGGLDDLKLHEIQAKRTQGRRIDQ